MAVSGPDQLLCCNNGTPNSLTNDWQKYGKFIIEDKMNIDDKNCKMYRFQFFGNEKEVTDLVCHCSERFFGASCDLATAGSTGAGGGSSSFKMSILLAVIPLSFAVFAAVGGFLCKITPCCFCIDIVKWPTSASVGSHGRRCPLFGRKKTNDDVDNNVDCDQQYYDEYYARRTVAAAMMMSPGDDDLLQVDVHSVDLVPVVAEYDYDGYDNGRRRFDDRVADDLSQVADSSADCSQALPPPFSSLSCQAAGHSLQQQQQHCANCARKYSPPPAYADICQQEAATALRTISTQT